MGALPTLCPSGFGSRAGQRQRAPVNGTILDGHPCGGEEMVEGEVAWEEDMMGRGSDGDGW